MARNTFKISKAEKLNAADTGLAHHKFLQFFAFEKAVDLKAFEAEAKSLEKEGYLSEEEGAALDLDTLAQFWSSDIGKKIAGMNAKSVQRELAFTAGFKPREIDEILGKKSATDSEDEVIVVQGVADLVVLLPKEIWLLDFKTDEIKASELKEKIKTYAPQLKLYARALEKIIFACQ